METRWTDLAEDCALSAGGWAMVGVPKGMQGQAQTVLSDSSQDQARLR